jgi:protein-arginine kinase activator protein McsA
MFGFPLLDSLGMFPRGSVSMDELLDAYLGKQEEVDLLESKLLDTYTYVAGDIKYEQKVYRLKNGALYTTTTQDTDASLTILRKQLDKAVEIQDFERAAILRDKINSLK